MDGTATALAVAEGLSGPPSADDGLVRPRGVPVGCEGTQGCRAPESRGMSA